eukprot:RCo055447
MDLNWKLPDELQSCTPSSRDGVTAEEELSKRIQMCRAIRVAAKALGLASTVAVPTALVFLHRVLTVISLRSPSAEDLPCAVLFLAAKVESCPRRLSDFVHRFYNLPKIEQGHEPKRRAVMKLEREVITALGFEFTLEHPGSLLDQIVDELGLVDDIRVLTKGRSHELLEDYEVLPLGLQFEPREVAAAVLYMALYSVVGGQGVTQADDQRLLTALSVPAEVVAKFCARLQSLCQAARLPSRCLDFVAPPWLTAHPLAQPRWAPPPPPPPLPSPSLPPPPAP